MTIIEAIQDPALFRPLFRNLDSWRAWLVVLRAIFALPCRWMMQRRHCSRN